MSSIFSKDQKRAQTKLIYRPLDSTLELILGHPDDPLEGSKRITEDLVPKAAHLCFLSPHSTVVLEVSTEQSLVLSVRFDGGWRELTAHLVTS